MVGSPTCSEYSAPARSKSVGYRQERVGWVAYPVSRGRSSALCGSDQQRSADRALRSCDWGRSTKQRALSLQTHRCCAIPSETDSRGPSHPCHLSLSTDSFLTLASRCAGRLCLATLGACTRQARRPRLVYGNPPAIQKVLATPSATPAARGPGPRQREEDGAGNGWRATPAGGSTVCRSGRPAPIVRLCPAYWPGVF